MRVSYAWERVLEKTLLRGSSGSGSYCYNLLCPDMWEASNIVSNLETLQTAFLRTEKGKKELDMTALTQQLIQQPTAWASTGLGRKPCTRL